MNLKIENLSFRYGTDDVLRSISLDTSEGQFVGLLGPNASGKTTLIKNIAGLLWPTRGEVLINQKSLLENSIRERARLISYVPQEDDVFLPFTVEQIVAMGRAPHLGFLGFESQTDHDKIREAMEQTETLSLRTRSFFDLSGGERRRAVIARALAQEAPILLMDEPTSHLDIHHQIALLELGLRLTRKRGLITLISLHDINLASLYCDQIILLQEGRIFATGTPQEVITEKNLRDIFQTPCAVRSENQVPFYYPKRA